MRGVDLEIIVPLPLRALRGAASWMGRNGWKDAVDDAIRAIEPKPTVIPFLPVPRRSYQSAAMAVAASLIARPPARRPKLVEGCRLDVAGFCATFVARSLEVPSIAVAWSGDLSALQRLEGPRRRRARFAFDRATYLATVCRSMAVGLAELGRAAEVIPFGPSTRTFSPSPRNGGPVLFVGTIGHSRRVDVLLDAMALLPELSLLLVGAIEPGFDLPFELRRRGLGERVSQRLPCEPSELAASYAACSVVVVPGRSEGVPPSMIEALLSGRPVVATASPSATEVIDEAVGRRVTGDDLEAWRDAIRTCATQTFDPSKLRAKGLEFSGDVTADRLTELTARALSLDVPRAELR